jgi:hypothetical protein
MTSRRLSRAYEAQFADLQRQEIRVASTSLQILPTARLAARHTKPSRRSSIRKVLVSSNAR